MTTPYPHPKLVRNAAIVQMRRDGASIKEIATKSGLRRESISRIIALYAPDLTGTMRIHAKYSKIWPKESVDEIRRLQNEGLSFSQIGAKLGKSVGMIAGKVRRLKAAA